jgi:hypothetical protein
MTTKTASTPDTAEGDFILHQHEKQMAAASPAQAYYHQMNKEMMPALITMLQGAACSDDQRRQGAELALGYAQHVASCIVAMAAIMGGEGDAHRENRESLARTLTAAMTDFVNKNLAMTEKIPV